MIRASLATKLLLLSLVPGLSVALAWLAVARSLESSEGADAQVLPALRALELTNEVAALADEAVLEERAYLVAGGDGFPEPFHQAVQSFGVRVRELERLLAASPELSAELAELKATFERWQRDVATPAMAARRDGNLEVSAELTARAGRQLSFDMNQIAQRLASAQGAAVRARLREGGRKRARATRLAVGVVVLTMSVGASVGIWFALQLRPSLGQLEAAAEALAGGDYDRRADAGTSDEIGRLARSFNAMADQVRERTHEAAGLRRLSELLQACGTVEEALDVTERVVPSLLPASRVVLHLLNASRTELEVATHLGEGAESAADEPAAPSDCWAFRRGVAHRVTSGEAIPACRHAGTELGSYVCIPLLAHGENLGVLTLAPPPDAARAAFAERLAEQIALAIANLELRESLRSQAIRDPLTGLFNRRYFDEAAERELARAQRHQRSLVFMVLDVDHFKRFNDTHGHDAGDLLLREVGQLLRSSVRQSDIACRYGGEEFVLILPESALEDARRRAELIRESFHHLGVSHHGKLLGQVSVSIGVAAFPEHGHERSTLLRKADAALYRAKDEGRDRVVVA